MIRLLQGILKTVETGAGCLLLAALSASALPAQGLTAGDRLSQLEGISIEQQLGAQVPLELPFHREDGQEVQLSEYFGKEKPIVLVLAYYECPMLCTEVLNGVLRAVRTLQFNAGEEFEIVTISIDPDETPELATQKKAFYVERYGRAGGQRGWHFLTGPESSIGPVAKAVGFGYRYDPQTDLYTHASGIMLLTPEGRVSRYFYGVEFSARDLRLGMVEASAGGIGSVVDQVLLYCYRYDPSLGQYSLVIMNVLRAAAVATILALALLLFWLFRQDSSTPRKPLPTV